MQHDGLNFSGTGNTLHCANRCVSRMILDSLRHWVIDCHVDGFRFDEASVFMSDENNRPYNYSPIFWDMQYSQKLLNSKFFIKNLDPARYTEFIGESVEEFSYLKSPFYEPLGYPNGMYRVGPLARLNIIDRAGTPLADQELAEFRTLERGAVLSSFHYHYARLIEILHGIEKIEMILNDKEILSSHVRALARPNAFEGVGVSEAPRGTLMHHYKIDEDGLMVWANLIIATGHNNLAMNRGVLQVAKHFVDGRKLQEGMLNRVEAVIRAYDPCLSCSTHALGKMPLLIELVEPDGRIVDELRREK